MGKSDQYINFMYREFMNGQRGHLFEGEMAVRQRQATSFFSALEVCFVVFYERWNIYIATRRIVPTTFAQRLLPYTGSESM